MLEFAPISARMKSRCKPSLRGLSGGFENHRTSRSIVAVLLLSVFAISQAPAPEIDYPQISRPVRTWEFVPVVGRKAAIFGNESGKLEAWVYPMKFLRDFTLMFHLADRSFPAAALARNLEVRAESATITYAHESFTVRDTIFVPHDQ